MAVRCKVDSGDIPIYGDVIEGFRGRSTGKVGNGPAPLVGQGRSIDKLEQRASSTIREREALQSRWRRCIHEQTGDGACGGYGTYIDGQSRIRVEPEDVAILRPYKDGEAIIGTDGCDITARREAEGNTAQLLPVQVAAIVIHKQPEHAYHTCPSGSNIPKGLAKDQPVSSIALIPIAGLRRAFLFIPVLLFPSYDRSYAIVECAYVLEYAPNGTENVTTHMILENQKCANNFMGEEILKETMIGDTKSGVLLLMRI